MDLAHTATRGALSDLLVIELGDEGTQNCCKLLADMGATVVKVEPPGGAPARHRGPFKDGNRDANTSLFFWAYNTSKQSVVLDLDEIGDRDLLARLAARADLVVEDFAPGTLDSLGLGFEELVHLNPALVMTSITPFGQTGPISSWHGPDIVTMAMGGAMAMVGYSDPSTPPLTPQGDLSFQLAAQWAAIGSLAAIEASAASGQGQHVDISIQEVIAFITGPYGTAPYEYSGSVVERNDASNLVQTADGGYVVAQMLNIPIDRWLAFREWLKAEHLGAALHDVDPNEFESKRAEVLAAVAEIAMTRTRAQLSALGQSFGFTWMAVNDPEDLVDDDQLVHRGFFRPVEHPELDATYLYAGPPTQWSEAPWRISSRPPLLGEHSEHWRAALSADED
jgi:crotonobetainyl-CoA:carnitine CoA-transferase CaiB-like acyl-CoA transferase